MSLDWLWKKRKAF